MVGQRPRTLQQPGKQRRIPMARSPWMPLALLTVAAWTSLPSASIRAGEKPEGPTVLQTHQGVVWWAAFSPADGKTLALACKDQTVRLWDVAAGKELATL